MCNFFSFISDGQGNIKYFNAEMRRQIIAGEYDYDMDSHTSICDYHRLNEDNCNKYEFNPLTREFTIDQINNRVDDSERIKGKMQRFDFKKVVPELVVKPIVSPFDVGPVTPTDDDIELLKQWATVRGSVMYSVWDSDWVAIVDSVSEERIMWGSDYGFGWADSVKYRLHLMDHVKMPDEKRVKIMGANAINLFKINSL